MSPSNRVQPRAELAYFAALIMRAAFAKVHVSNHVEVVVIDVDHFDGVFVNQGVWERPANDFSFREVGCNLEVHVVHCLLYTSPSPRDGLLSRMPSSA